MAETVSLKALARQILAREREQESMSQECPSGAGIPLGHHAPFDAFALGGRTVAGTNGEPSIEQPCAARRGRVQVLPDGPMLHFCCRCGCFAAFGYGVRLRAGRLGRWFCGEHRPR